MYHYSYKLTIPSGSALSDAIALGTIAPVGLYMPEGWDAAALAFDVSLDGENFEPLYGQNGAEVTVQVAASKATVINAADYAGFPYLRLRSAVNQTADREIVVILRAY